MKLYTSGWLNIYLIFYVVHVKIGLSHRIHDVYIIILMKCMIYSLTYEAILKILLLSMEECFLDFFY